MTGFPLTDTSLGGAFAVTTGHGAGGTDWGALAAVDTLVVLMGGTSLAEICEQLVAAGRPQDTPVSGGGMRAGCGVRRIGWGGGALHEGACLGAAPQGRAARRTVSSR